MAVMPIERGKVREYAKATAADVPAYVDDEKAPIPPTFLSTVVLWTPLGDSVLRAPEVAEACASAGLQADVRSLLSLGQEYRFFGPLPRVGDTLTTSERLESVEVKQARSGPMVLVRFVVSFHDEPGTLRAECLYTSAYVTR